MLGTTVTSNPADGLRPRASIRGPILAWVGLFAGFESKPREVRYRLRQAFLLLGLLSLAAKLPVLPASAFGADTDMPVGFGGEVETSDLCRRWAVVAASEHGVPAQLMLAITLVETKLDLGGRPSPWPWAVNVEGEGRWFGTRAEAQGFVEDTIASARSSIDIGCFQVNLQWHGAAFAGPADMLDPAGNARYAARFLAALHDELGDWTRATAAYHSRSPGLGNAYVGRVAAALDQVSDTDGAVAGRHAAPGPEPRKDIGVAKAAVPVIPGPLRSAPGAPTGWTRAPTTAATTGAPLGSLMPAPTSRAGPGSGSAATLFARPKP